MEGGGSAQKSLKIMGEALLYFWEWSKQKFQHSGFSHNFEAFLSASSLHVAASKSELECWS